MVEIERKFLVKNTDFLKEAHHQKTITQGYLSTHPERTVRIRIQDDQSFITIKGKGNDSGTTRFEWEKEIELEEAQSLIKLCEDYPVSKTRYDVLVEEKIFEVDVFHGRLEPLIIAEVELLYEEEAFIRPSWLGEEVTGQKEYYNAYLSQK